MRKLITVLMISAVLIVSGISTTIFSSGQVSTYAWGDDGGGD